MSLPFSYSLPTPKCTELASPIQIIAPSVESEPLQLEYPICIVYDLCLFKNLPSQFLELVMSGVIIDIVVSILGAFKLYNKRVRDAILYNVISIGGERSGVILGKRCHTWAPSGELSVPPDADLIYGFPDVG